MDARDRRGPDASGAIAAGATKRPLPGTEERLFVGEAIEGDGLIAGGRSETEETLL